MTAHEILFAVAFGIGVLGLALMYAITRWSRPPIGPASLDPYAEVAEEIRRQQREWAAGPSYYTTPKDFSKCRNLVKDGPTPCWHPHCDCMTTDYAEPRPRLGHDEVLRRHLRSTRKDSKRVSP